VGLYLVTGASSGIGRELCAQLVGRGDTVCGVARRREVLEQMRGELSERFVPIPCDVTDLDAVVRACASLPALPDTVILNAGMGIGESSKRVDTDIHSRTLATNYFGAIHFVDALLPRFIERGAGTFAATSSLAAWRGIPRSAAYGASKAALTSAFESMRGLYWRHGVRFVTIHPGFVDTPMTRGQKGMFLVWTPERAVRRILRGLDRGCVDITFPLGTRLLLGLLRLLPARLYLEVSRRM